MLRLLSLIFFFLLIRQPLEAKDLHAAHGLSDKSPLSSFASLSFKHGSFKSITFRSYKSIFFKTKKRRTRGTKMSDVRLPLNPVTVPFAYKSVSFFFSRELILASCSVTPPHRGPPSLI